MFEPKTIKASVNAMMVVILSKLMEVVEVVRKLVVVVRKLVEVVRKLVEVVRKLVENNKLLCNCYCKKNRMHHCSDHCHIAHHIEVLRRHYHNGFPGN